MGAIQNLIKGIGKNGNEFKEKLKQAQEENRIANLVEQRQKSSNRRELERHMEEKEEAEIKEELHRIHKKQNSELWKSPNMILSKGKSILTNDKPILKEKNIFTNSKSNNLINKHGMFFK